MNEKQLQEAADSLWEAAASGRWIAPLRDKYLDIDGTSAYAIQKINADRRVAEGRRIVGRKVGLTARTVQKQLGVEQPDFGVLFDDMGFGDGEPVPLRFLQQPRIEAEIAFMIGRDLDMSEPTMVDAIRAIDHALPALEIVGSRIDNWNIRFADTVADNASSAAYVLGSTPRRISEFDLRLCGMAMTLRGEPVSVGAGCACLGNPLNAVLWLARTMTRLGSPLRAGDIVLSGALGPMAPVRAGDIFEARIHGLGTVKAVFEGAAT